MGAIVKFILPLRETILVIATPGHLLMGWDTNSAIVKYVKLTRQMVSAESHRGSS